MADEDRPGFLLPLLLLAVFRDVVDQAHLEAADRGHADARPMHAFALQAIGPDGATTSELGRRLGITRQGAAKTIRALEGLDYVTREPDPGDERSTIIRRSAHGEDFLAVSAAGFDRARDRIVRSLGSAEARRLEEDLLSLAPEAAHAHFADLPGWLGSGA